jgi:heat shock protein HslJ
MKGISMRVILTATVALLAACSGKPSADTAKGIPPDSAKVAATPPATDTPVVGVNLRGPEWRLVSLGDKPVTFADTTRAARIALHPDSRQVTGSGGCNRMFGVYELKGDEGLRFSGVGSTKMACKDGMDTESAFLGSLLRVAKWKITGKQLELRDSTGTVLATLETR